MADFNDWGVADAKQAIEDVIVEQLGSREAYDSNAAYLEDQDHWQDGSTWLGPNGGSQLIWNERVKPLVERSFTPVGGLEEVMGRMANALLKKAPEVDFVPIEPPEEGSPQEKELRDQSDRLRQTLIAWAEKAKLLDRVRDAAIRSRWSTRGTLRAWIAEGDLKEEETEAEVGEAQTVLTLPKGLELSDALDRVQVMSPLPHQGYVFRDESARQDAGIFVFKDDEDREAAEIWSVDGDQTQLRIVRDSGPDEEFSMSIGGRMPIVEMAAKLLVTEPVRKIQAQVDFQNTLLTRVSETAGFPERYFINAAPSGIWLQTPPLPDGSPEPGERYEDEDGTTWYLHKAPRQLGAMVTTDLVGIEQTLDDDGKKVLATPSVKFKEPTDPEYVINAKNDAYRTLLRQCKQGHVDTESTGEASGEAYQQARADYEDDLDSVRGPLEDLIRDVIEVVIAMAEAMGPDATSVLETFRVNVQLNVRSGSITPEEKRQNNEDVKAGTLSRESAMAASGVEDVDAELKKIQADPESQIELRRKQVDVMIQLTGAGTTWEQAAAILGIEDEQLLTAFKDVDSSTDGDGGQSAAQDGDIQEILTGTTVGA